MYQEYLVVLVVAFIAASARKFLGSKSAAQQATAASPSNAAFRAFQRKFLFVYLTMMAADWMQGPYVYKLYETYGFSRQDNGVLFIAGFGSSLIFGTWAGPLADKYGRKLNCILYGITYALSCATKHVPDFGVLMVGRLLGGFATSILWSAFESWMVSEHNARAFPAEDVSDTFSLMVTLNGLVAIGSGFVAQAAVSYFGHPVAPFDVSALFLVLGTLFIWFSWSENYGETTGNMAVQMREAIQLVSQDKRIAFAGLQQASFEGAMYTFVFMWTPTLETPGAEPVPHGLVFASFMIACSLGSTLFSIASEHMPITTLLRYLFLGAAFAMAVPMMTENHTLIMGSFLGFEMIVGMFWPSIGTLRAKYIPESHRATITNLFRVPLNLIVCCVLYFQGGMTIGFVFCICVLFHLFAFVMALLLSGEVKSQADEAEARSPVVSH